MPPLIYRIRINQKNPSKKIVPISESSLTFSTDDTKPMTSIKSTKVSCMVSRLFSSQFISSSEEDNISVTENGFNEMEQAEPTGVSEYESDSSNYNIIQSSPKSVFPLSSSPTYISDSQNDSLISSEPDEDEPAPSTSAPFSKVDGASHDGARPSTPNKLWSPSDDDSDC